MCYHRFDQFLGYPAGRFSSRQKRCSSGAHHRQEFPPAHCVLLSFSQMAQYTGYWLKVRGTYYWAGKPW